MARHEESYNLRKIFEQMEFDLISSMRRNLKRHEQEEEKEGFKWEQWQSAKLRNLRRYQGENQKIVSSWQDKIKGLARKSIQNSYQNGQSLFKQIVNRIARFFGHKIVLQEPISADLEQEEIPFAKKVRELDDNFFHLNDRKIKALEQTVEKDLNKAQTAVMRKMNDVYRKTIYAAEVHMAAGAKSLDQAVDMATKSFLAQGINCIQYKNGRLVNIASYAEMALRTAAHRATLLGEGKKRAEFGVYTVVVSAHANTCELCLPWQGKVLIDDVFSGLDKESAIKLLQESKYPLLSSAIEAGLLHPNCRHSLITYFPGITQIPTIPDGKKALKRYDAEQKQRYLEQQIRKWKRIVAGSLDPDNTKSAQEKVKAYQSELRKHLKENDFLRRDYSREKTRDIPIDKNINGQYKYENFDKEHLAQSPGELLPNHEKAYGMEDKLSGYSLNMNHPKGKDKAIAFEKYLGYNSSNKDLLLEQIQQGLNKYKYALRKENQYGQPYEVQMVLKGVNDKYAKVKSGWIVEKGEDIPRMTTIYVDE